MENIRIYLAGGWWTPDMMSAHKEVTNVLDELAFLNVHNPRLMGENHANEELVGTDGWAREIFYKNIEHMDMADMAVIILNKNGQTESGTSWEVGYLVSKRLPSVYVCIGGGRFQIPAKALVNALCVLFDPQELKNYPWHDRTVIAPSIQPDAIM